MARTEQKPDGKGSQRDIQILVNRRPDLLSDAVRQAQRVGSEKIDWDSPRSDDGYAEYSDGDFLAKIGRADPSLTWHASGRMAAPNGTALESARVRRS